MLAPVFSCSSLYEEVQTVNARDVHAFLGVGRDFSNWIKGRIEEFGFVQGTDFEIFDSPDLADQTGRGGDRRSKHYALTLSMAKELCMVERNEQGKRTFSSKK
ncbi:MAG: antA/AntB antirepressor family protein [Bdellovibrionales bacterium]